MNFFMILLSTVVLHAGEIKVDNFIPNDSKVCVEKVTEKQKKQLAKWGWDSLKSITKIETFPFEKGYVCSFEFNPTPTTQRFVIAYLGKNSDSYKGIYDSHIYSHIDCDNKKPVVNPHLVQLTIDKQVKPLLFIEKGEEVGNCAGDKGRFHSELQILDPDKEPKPMKVLEFANTCSDGNHEECSPKEKLSNYSAAITWAFCETSCDQLEIIYTDFLDKKTKAHSKFISLNKHGKIIIK
jgi:hypothetical protein